MPIYEYQCTACGDVEEVLQKFSDKPLKKCRYCSGKVQKLISNSSFHLKGTGWYVTDYANKSKKPSPPSKSTEKTTTNQPDKSKKTTDKTPKQLIPFFIDFPPSRTQTNSDLQWAYYFVIRSSLLRDKVHRDVVSGDLKNFLLPLFTNQNV